MSVNIYNDNAGTLTPIAGVPGLKLTKLTENQAAVEKLSTSTAAYNIGDYIIRNNDGLYKVISPVSQGDAWSVGTNIEPTSLGSEITENYNSIEDKLSSSIEVTNSAASAHSEGEYLQYTDGNGIPRFAKVTSAIAVNDTITNGINVDNTNVGSELTTLKELIDEGGGGGPTPGSEVDIFSIFDNCLADMYNWCNFANDTFEFGIDEYRDNWSANATMWNSTSIDLTDYDELKFQLVLTDQAGYGYFWVTLSQTKYNWDRSSWPGCYINETSVLKVTESGTYTIDVSTLSGGYYIYVGGTTGKVGYGPGGCDNTLNGKIEGRVVSFLAVPSGAGGSTKVVANPAAPATDMLRTVQIGNTVYDIEGSGSGEGNGIVDILYEASDYAGTLNLSKNLFNYDLITMEVTDGNGYTRAVSFAPIELEVGQVIGFDNTFGHVWYTLSDGITLVNTSRQNFYISSIVGMKMHTEELEKTLIYENQASGNESTITLTESFRDFDEIRIVPRETNSAIYYPEQIIPKSELEDALADQTNVYITPYFYSNMYYCYYTVTSETTLELVTQGGAFKIDRIYGVKYGAGGDSYGEEIIFTGLSSTTSPITLTKNINEFDLLEFVIAFTDHKVTGIFEIPVKYFVNNYAYSPFSNISVTDNVSFTLAGSQWYRIARGQVDTQLQFLKTGGDNFYLKSVIGIKTGGSGAGGGGGGSTVTITPIVSSGVKIADFSINGTNGSLYTPKNGAEDLFSIFDTCLKDSHTPSASLSNGVFSFNINDTETNWSQSATIFNSEAFDLTYYDKVRLTLNLTDQSDYGAFWITFSQVKYTWNDTTWPGCYINVDSALKMTESGVYTVDVSELTGDYYIYVGGTTGKATTNRGGCTNNQDGKIIGTMTTFEGIIGADVDYDDLIDKPQINGVTLSGNKTSKQLGIRQTIPITKEDYDLLSTAEKMDVDKDYILTNVNAVNVPIDDTSTSAYQVWSSQKTNTELGKAKLIHKTQEEYDALPSADKLDPDKHYLITNATLSGAPLDDSSISNGKVWSSQKVNNEISNKLNQYATLNLKNISVSGSDAGGYYTGVEITNLIGADSVPYSVVMKDTYIGGASFTFLHDSQNRWFLIINASKSFSYGSTDRYVDIYYH